MKNKNIRLRFFENTMYMHIISSIKLKNIRKRKYTSHTIARLTVFTHAFCHTRVENLLRGRDNDNDNNDKGEK